MYFSLKLQKNYSSKLTKIVVLSLAISAAFISSFEQVILRVKKHVMLKLVIFANDESAGCLSLYLSLNGW